MKNGRRSPSKVIFLSFLVIVLTLATACGPKAETPKKPVVVEKPPEEEVFKNMKEEETAALIDKVRTYAEAFDIGTVDKDIKKEIMGAIPKGTTAEDALEPALIIIDEFMEEKLKEKIAEGLDEYVGKHTEEDVQMVYDEMNVSPLIEFILHYEIERLKQEGYLR